MSEEAKKNLLNVPGKYYVTEDCLACEVCISAAPENFKLSEDSLSYIFKQPATSEEEQQCREALAGCPMGAIRDDGVV